MFRLTSIHLQVRTLMHLNLPMSSTTMPFVQLLWGALRSINKAVLVAGIAVDAYRIDKAVITDCTKQRRNVLENTQ